MQPNVKSGGVDCGIISTSTSQKLVRAETMLVASVTKTSRHDQSKWWTINLVKKHVKKHGFKIRVASHECQGVSFDRPPDSFFKSLLRLSTYSREAINIMYCWPLWGKSTGNGLIPRINGHKGGKCVHVMMSPWWPSTMGGIHISDFIIAIRWGTYISPGSQTNIQPSSSFMVRFEDILRSFVQSNVRVLIRVSLNDFLVTRNWN